MELNARQIGVIEKCVQKRRKFLIGMYEIIRESVAEGEEEEKINFSETLAQWEREIADHDEVLELIEQEKIEKDYL